MVYKLFFHAAKRNAQVFRSGLFYLIPCIVVVTTLNELLTCYVDKIEVPTRFGFDIGIMDFSVDLAVIDKL